MSGGSLIGQAQLTDNSFLPLVECYIFKCTMPPWTAYKNIYACNSVCMHVYMCEDAQGSILLEGKLSPKPQTILEQETHRDKAKLFSTACLTEIALLRSCFFPGQTFHQTHKPHRQAWVKFRSLLKEGRLDQASGAFGQVICSCQGLCTILIGARCLSY